MLRPIALATLVAGTLDILFAMILTVSFDREIPNMLRYVAAGPFPAAADMGIAGAELGLIVHFGLMAIMATIFMAAVGHRPSLNANPWVAAVVYGLATYVVMNWLVVPLRFGSQLPPRTVSIITQLFAHIVLVGIPFALIARKYLRPAAPASS